MIGHMELPPGPGPRPVQTCSLGEKIQPRPYRLVSKRSVGLRLKGLLLLSVQPKNSPQLAHLDE